MAAEDHRRTQVKRNRGFSDLGRCSDKKADPSGNGCFGATRHERSRENVAALPRVVRLGTIMVGGGNGRRFVAMRVGVFGVVGGRRRARALTVSRISARAPGSARLGDQAAVAGHQIQRQHH